MYMYYIDMILHTFTFFKRPIMIVLLCHNVEPLTYQVYIVIKQYNYAMI